ncbi:DsbA family protein [Haloarchaeobius sp. HRN-SO-5]|uniref:DsbA family protein n=1 Tax=Haloarchaeobius sp. HRN-SO-5 TaxID=3446118 RepID=UPI003EBA1E62
MELPDSLTTRRALLGSVGATLAGTGVVYGASRLDPSGPSSMTPAPMHSSSETTGLGVALQGHPVMGSMDAPLDIYYWSDYQCPFCQRFERDTLPSLVDDYVRPGDVRLVFIEYPYLGQRSWTAAVMDRCVWRQVREDDARAYWRWHSAVFAEQDSGTSEWASKANLLEVTRGVEGVDAAAVEDCLATHRSDVEAAIEDDVAQARRFGIRGTPAFVVYNRDADAAGKLVGAQPYERFEEAIRRVQNA